LDRLFEYILIMYMKFKPKTIHLRGKGFNKVLGELESKIMKLIWQTKETTVRSMCDSLIQQKHKISFNTTMTVMNRLVKKGLLKKCSKNKEYTYCSVFSQKEFSRTVVSDIISSVVKDPALFSASSFAGLASEIDEDTLQKLKDFLGRH